jgi:long-subunit fatty acid transport protein
MRPRRSQRSSVFLALALLAICGRARLSAQTNLETNAGVQFNFSTPGAGNLALGGAFLGLAFDASAAYTNPAGLTLVAAPEALVEARHWRYTHVFTDRGRIEGVTPTFQFPDTIPGLQNGKAEDQVTGLSFLSYVYPRRNWSFAVYRHELVNFEANFSTFGAYLEGTLGRNPLGIPGTFDGRLAALRNHMQVDVVAYGGAAACRLGGGFSLGVALSSYDFSIDSTADRFRPELFAEPRFAVDPLVNFQTQRGNDRDWGVNAGFFWASSESRWSVGGVYRQGPDFTFRARSRQGPGAIVDIPEADQQAFFHVPDVYGVGVGFRPTDALRLAFDFDRVRYSQLTDGFVDIFDLAAFPPGSLDGAPELDKFRIDDADELHLGLEYAFLKHWPVLTLRAGTWYEQDHSLRFEGENVGFRAVFRPHGDQMHYTAGMGLTLRRVQLDAAVDHSNRVSVIALSAGFRFE